MQGFHRYRIGAVPEERRASWAADGEAAENRGWFRRTMPSGRSYLNRPTQTRVTQRAGP
jgi:hypothetical protein